MSGKQFFIKKKLLPTEVKRHLILNGHAGTRYLTTGLNVANWAPRGEVTWASRSSGPTCVQKGRSGISSTTDGRERPKFGSRWSPINWAGTYPHKMAAQQWAPGMDGLGHPLLGNQVCPTWMPTSAQSGHPPLPNLGVHACPTWKPISIHVGHPTLSTLEVHFCPYWIPTPTHVGLPTLSTMEAHACPRWMSMLVHTGRPNPPRLEAQLCPCRESMSVHVGNPCLSILDCHLHPSWKSISTHEGCPLLPKLEAQSLCVDAQKLPRFGSPSMMHGRPEAAEVGQPILAPGRPHAKGGCPKRTRKPTPNCGSPLIQVATRPVREWMPNAEQRTTTPSCWRP